MEENLTSEQLMLKKTLDREEKKDRQQNYHNASIETTEPIGNLVIVQVEEAETKTQSGLYIPQTSQEQPNKGTIVAVGNGVYAPATGTLIPMQTKVGDKVSYPQHIGADIEIDGVNYKIMKETELWAKL